MRILSFIFTICLSFGFRTGAVMDTYQEMRAQPQSDSFPFPPDISDDILIERLGKYIEEVRREREEEEEQEQKRNGFLKPIAVNNNNDNTINNREHGVYAVPFEQLYDADEVYHGEKKYETVKNTTPNTTSTPTVKSSQKSISTSSAGSGTPEVRIEEAQSVDDIYYIAFIAGTSAAGLMALIVMGIFWHKWHKKYKAAVDVEYPAYGVTGPSKEISPTGDRRLAQSAQMYHYQHQKQQILAMENSTHALEQNGSLSEPDSEDDNEEGDYTVYECPGPAPIGEMEVRNPLFLDDPTPATTPANATNKK